MTTVVDYPTPAARTRGGPYFQRSLRLYLQQRLNAYVVPVLILLAMLAFTVVAGLIIGIGTGLPLHPDISAGFRSGNLGAIWALPGFFISSAAMHVNRTFATALALGSTRRDFWIGSTLGFSVTALVTGVVGTALMLMERATDGWFIGAYGLDVSVLGSGNVLLTFLTLTLLALAGMFLGAGFGTIFRAHGPAVLTVVIIGLVLLLAGLAALAVWRWQDLAPLLAATGAWSTALVLAVITVGGA
ncbi:MAG: hypothetical protein Q4G40_11050, partial [Brachybacterium sp.]|nr:hypothetical protein [Brachybacterium sp.]